MPVYRAQLTLKKAMLLVAAAALVFAVINVMFSAVGAAREAALRAECVDHFKQVGLTLHNYHSAWDSLPPGVSDHPTLPPEKRTAWRFAILYFIEQWGGSFEYDTDYPWDSPGNRALHIAGTDSITNQPFRRPVGDIQCFRCPSNPSKSKPGQAGDAHFLGIAGVGLDAPTLPQGDPKAGIFGYDRITRFSDVTDGLANTVMVVETIQNNGPITAGGSFAVRGLNPAKPPYIGGKKGQFGGTHPGGADVLFADGSVRFVRETIAPKTFEALSTISGGEPTSDWR